MDELNKKILTIGYREEGKLLYFGKASSAEDKQKGLSYIFAAAKALDPEAMYIIGMLLVDDVITVSVGNSLEEGLSMLSLSARRGYLPARTKLNEYCRKDYQERVGERAAMEFPLVDFEGNKITIDRSGIFTPVDAKLEFVDGLNVLTLSANLLFASDFDKMPGAAQLRDAVVEGIMEWQGDYEVFGGQKLRLDINLTFDIRILDNVVVMPMTKEYTDYMLNFASVIPGDDSDVKKLTDEKRSFTFIGKKWKVNSGKFIYLQSENYRFDNYESIKNSAKHEFGHVLGLGDLYRNVSDGLEGVDKGTYPDIDSYHIKDKAYNLVMCDSYGPISNNDIEMVVLAFSENCLQNYQPSKIHGEISRALGRGN